MSTTPPPAPTPQPQTQTPPAPAQQSARPNTWLRGLAWGTGVLGAAFGSGEHFLRWIADNSNPVILGRVLFTVTAGLSLLALRYTTTWVDWCTVAGFVVTVAGFTYTIYQLFQTQSALQATQEGARRQSAEHYRHTLVRCQNYLGEANTLIHAKRWTEAALRASDLAGETRHIQHLRNHANDRWIAYAGKLQQWSVTFRAAPPNKPLVGQNLDDWWQLTHMLGTSLEQELAPMQFQQGV